jgi:formylglycine-generating enzyme
MIKAIGVWTVLGACLGMVAADVVIDTVPVGDVGNAGEWSGAGYGGYGPDAICGGVGYEYKIGAFEITAGQYTQFLNSVATTDTYNLYATGMAGSNGCKIVRSGSAGSYTYSVAADYANRPVNYVAWQDAARFANWMHNGQPTGAQDLSSTEDGSYLLDGATTNEVLLQVVRKPNATWVIPTENEWYKAAYYNPATGTYFKHATSSNTAPGKVIATPDPGNNAAWNNPLGSPYLRTEVGEFENSYSPYGTFDQAGNLWEFNETLFNVAGLPFRGNRGGGYSNIDAKYLASNWRSNINTTNEIWTQGFRLGMVPEPTALALVTLGLLTVVRRSRG